MDDTNFIAHEDDDRPLFTSRRHRKRSPEHTAGGLILLTLLLAAGAGGWLRHRAHTSPSTTPVTAAIPLPPPPAVPAPTARPADLPALGASDAFVRTIAAELSSRPRLASWLATDGLVHRFVLAVVDVSVGRSPGSPLAFLSPERPFTVTVREGRLVTNPGSYHRYDAMAATFASLDTEGTARLFRRLEPLMEVSYRQLGLSDATFQETVARAFGRLLAVRFPETPAELRQGVTTYLYADESLEDAPGVVKDLLRVGPENGHIIQEKLRALADAMGVEPIAPLTATAPAPPGPGRAQRDAIPTLDTFRPSNP